MQVHPSHQIVVYRAAGEDILVCLRCAGFGARKAPLLKEICQPTVPKHRQKVLKRCERGLHPSDKAHLKHILLDQAPADEVEKEEVEQMKGEVQRWRKEQSEAREQEKGQEEKMQRRALLIQAATRRRDRLQARAGGTRAEPAQQQGDSSAMEMPETAKRRRLGTQSAQGEAKEEARDGTGGAELMGTPLEQEQGDSSAEEDALPEDRAAAKRRRLGTQRAQREATPEYSSGSVLEQCNGSIGSGRGSVLDDGFVSPYGLGLDTLHASLYPGGDRRKAEHDATKCLDPFGPIEHYGEDCPALPSDAPGSVAWDGGEVDGVQLEEPEEEEGAAAKRRRLEAQRSQTFPAEAEPLRQLAAASLATRRRLRTKTRDGHGATAPKRTLAQEGEGQGTELKEACALTGAL